MSNKGIEAATAYLARTRLAAERTGMTEAETLLDEMVSATQALTTRLSAETARADKAVAEAKALRERIAMAADDFNPEGSNDAELALSEMRDFLRATLAQPADGEAP